jgi:hypothetical protein
VPFASKRSNSSISSQTSSDPFIPIAPRRSLAISSPCRNGGHSTIRRSRHSAVLKDPAVIDAMRSGHSVSSSSARLK